MRKILFALGVGAASLVGGAQYGVAQEYPWCSVGDTGTNCGYVGHAQCHFAASGTGAQCYPNPAYTNEYSSPALGYAQGDQDSSPVNRAQPRERQIRR